MDSLALCSLMCYWQVWLPRLHNCRLKLTAYKFSRCLPCTYYNLGKSSLGSWSGCWFQTIWLAYSFSSKANLYSFKTIPHWGWQNSSRVSVLLCHMHDPGSNPAPTMLKEALLLSSCSFSVSLSQFVSVSPSDKVILEWWRPWWQLTILRG